MTSHNIHQEGGAVGEQPFPLPPSPFPCAAEPRILFAAGGTGGHVYPALAIADAVRRLAPGARVAFAGTRERMEGKVVPKAGYRLHPITAVGLPRRLAPGAVARCLALPFTLMKGFLESWQLVGRFAPDVAVGTGGYVSGPVLLAAALRGVPIVLQEQNAYAGITNRLLARCAAEVHVAFVEARRYLPAERCIMSGNPTRAELSCASRAEGRAFFDVPEDAPLLFAFGGSLGSRALNEALEAHHHALLATGDVHLLWQTGARYYERLHARLVPHERVHLVKYVDRMDLAYAACDLALCRAGAITCSELMVTETPAVLVPSPNVAEDHQTKNAESMATRGAAVLLPEPALPEKLVETMQALLGDEARRANMAAAAARLAPPPAAENIAQHVLQRADGRRRMTNPQPAIQNPQRAQ